MIKGEVEKTTKHIYIYTGLLLFVYVLLLTSFIPKILGVLGLYSLFIVIIMTYSNISLEFIRSRSLAKFFLFVDYLIFIRYSFGIFQIIIFCMWFGLFIYLTKQDEKSNVFEFVAVYAVAKIIFILLLIFIQ